MEGTEGQYLNEFSGAKVSVWKKYSRNPFSVAGLIIILTFASIVLLGYHLCPDKSPYANTQILELAGKKPGFTVSMFRIDRPENKSKSGFFYILINGKSADYTEVPFLSYTFDDEKITLREYTDFPELEESYRTFSLPAVYYELDNSKAVGYERSTDSVFFFLKTGEQIQIPMQELRKRTIGAHIFQRKYLLGTDRFGRDLLSRLILGARISLFAGLIAVSISLIIGVFLGAVAGYFRGWTDTIVMWFINVIWSVPTLLLAIGLTMVLGRGFWQVFVAIGLTMWTEVARIVRGQVLSIREKEYIESARVLGYGNLRILSKHIIPNIIAPVIIVSAANFASAILMEAGLSFLGIGVQPPIPSWGGMVKEHYGYLLANKAYLAFLPGLAIMIVVLAFTSIGNGLRDAFDVRKN